jgi:signal recognition particle subunit SRP54
MFETLSEKLTESVRRLRGQARISESNLEEILQEVRANLLEADVNYAVVKDFLAKVKAKAIGVEVTPGVSPANQFVKAVFDELCELLGGQTSELSLKGFPAVIMLVGLQGSGKTTTAGKLALMLKGKGRSPFLVPADVYRPAAIDQLLILADELKIPAYHSTTIQKPEEIVARALQDAKVGALDTMIVDTAGRLHIDDELMDELARLKKILDPSEVMLVADAMTGQDAVNVAESFESKVGLTGVILTKLDGDARGGAALSIKGVTGKPIKLVGVGEKLEALEVFHPDRMAGRILDLGDILTLVEKASEVFDQKQAERLQKKLLAADFTLEDFRDMIGQVKKLGPLSEVMGMIPGMKQQMKAIPNLGAAEGELKRVEAIVGSMTKRERQEFRIINGSRRIRIAKGSGTTVGQVNRVLKSYLEMRKMMKKIKPSQMKNLLGQGLSKGGF